jgi:hypothetical protein
MRYNLYLSLICNIYKVLFSNIEPIPIKVHLTDLIIQLEIGCSSHIYNAVGKYKFSITIPLLPAANVIEE